MSVMFCNPPCDLCGEAEALALGAYRVGRRLWKLPVCSECLDTHVHLLKAVRPLTALYPGVRPRASATLASAR